MNKVSFVVPCYRSEKTVGTVVEEIRKTMDGREYEIILVNDGSPDGTIDAIQALAEADGRVIGVDLARNFGQHAALMAGFRQVTGDVVVCLDDDGQTPADEVDRLLAKLGEGYDAVYASYEDKKHTGFRNFGSWLNMKMTEIMLGKPKELYISSYFAVKRFVMDEMLRYEGCYPYVIGLVLRSTKNICNVPIEHREREVGASGYTLGKLINLWMNGFTSFSVKPLRLANYFGCLSAACGFIYIVVIIIRHFVVGAAPLGWSSTTALLLLIGGIILVVLGMMGEYIGRIYMCINATPQYLIREIYTQKKGKGTEAE